MDTLLAKFKPIIYIPNENESRTLKDVIYEKYEKYYVLWYHWPHDGYLTGREDYEPVILIIKKDNLVNIGIRPHNQYQNSTTWITENEKPVIVFVTAWHAPNIDQGQKILEIAKKPTFSKRIQGYVANFGQPSTWFVSADAGRSVYDYADSLSSM